MSKQIIILLILILSKSNFTYSQSYNCEIVSDSLFLVTFDIRNKGTYPIIMSGVSKHCDLKNFYQQDNIDAFMSSFYKKFNYVPDIYFNLKKSLSICIGDSLSSSIFNKDKYFVEKMLFSINKKNTVKILKLLSGETVFLSIIKLQGSFLKFPKDHKVISTNSNEYNISEIPEINICYLPFNIKAIKIKKK